MGKKKMTLPFLCRAPEAAPTSWPWPSCGTLKTLSFRAAGDMLKAADAPPPPELEDSIEAVIRGLRAGERLFFEPGESSSILEEAKGGNGLPFKESVVVAMDSRNPFVDFRRSMEEMVQSHGLKEWDRLEELLSCYLRVNGKSNHGYIIGAFVDLLVSFASASSSSSSSSSSSCSDHDRSSSTNSARSPVSQLSFSSSTCSTSPCSSSLEEDEIAKTVDNASSSNA